jgi:hypothetical protein
MRANGVDPSMMSRMDDPSQKLTLYKMESCKGHEKSIIAKSPGNESLSAAINCSQVKNILSAREK